MSFIFYDIGFLIVFSIFVFIFLYRRRKNLKREGIAYLYRTQVGIKVINYIGKKWKRTLKVISYFSITFGYVLMISAILLIAKTMQIFFQSPDFVRVVKIPPITPLIPYIGEIFKVDFLPPFYFTYWIIALAIVAIVHEFSHGIIANINKVRIKSTGFLFLGPFFGAFVEPDENKMKKIKKKDQIAILSAGSFSNLLLVLLFFLLMWLFFSLTYSPSGAIFDMYTFNIVNKSSISYIGASILVNFNGQINLTQITANNKTYFIETSMLDKLNETEEFLAYDDSPALKASLSGAITSIDNVNVRDSAELRVELLKHKPGETITVTAIQKDDTKKTFEIVLGENPADKSKPYLGIAVLPKQKQSVMGFIRGLFTFFREPNTYYSPKFNPGLILFFYNLLWWIVLINFSVAIVNMLPVGLFDGGRVFYLTVWALTKKEKYAKIAYKVSTYLLLAAVVLLMIFWVSAFI